MSTWERLLLAAAIGIVTLVYRGWIVAIMFLPFACAAVFFDELCKFFGGIWDRLIS